MFFFQVILFIFCDRLSDVQPAGVSTWLRGTPGTPKLYAVKNPIISVYKGKADYILKKFNRISVGVQPCQAREVHVDSGKQKSCVGSFIITNVLLFWDKGHIHRQAGWQRERKRLTFTEA